MNWESFKFAAIGAAQTLAQGWSYKALIAAMLAMILHKHALVFIDCFTKWVSISYLHLKDSGIENPTILESIKGIKKARAAKKIKSEVMKHRFLGKIGVYLICALSAAVVDVVMRVLDKPTWAVMTVIGYLVVTELLSIIENLNDAGVEAMSGLIVFVKKKL